MKTTGKIVGMGVVLTLAAFIFDGCKHKDTEYWGAQVHSKAVEISSCSHCKTDCDSDGNNCWPECDHTLDYDFIVKYDYNLNGKADDWRTFRSCGDCSLWGKDKAIWDDIKKGQWAVFPHSFNNYLLVDEDSLVLPAVDSDYAPSQIPGFGGLLEWDNFHSAISAGSAVSRKTLDDWNDFLLKENARLGHRHQVHIMTVFTKDQDPRYADALAHAWKLGKKNNAIFVFGVDSGSEITWARLVSFSENAFLKAHVENAFQGADPASQDTKKLVTSLVSKHFKRDSMSDMRYLMEGTWWFQWRAWIVGLMWIFIMTFLSVSKNRSRRW